MTEANEYAKALFLLSEEEGNTDTVLLDLTTVRDALIDNPTYQNLLDTPALSKEERLGLIDEAFSTVCECVKSVMKILCERHAIYTFQRLVRDFCALVDEKRGIERVEAISAVPMSEAQILALTKKIEALTGKTVIVSNTLDRSIIGGVKLRYSGIQVDGSLKTRLDGFEKALRGVVI